MARVLVVEEDRQFREFLREALTLGGHEVTLAADGPEARGALRQEPIQVMICDLMNGDADGLSLLAWAKEEQSDVEVILLTGQGSVESAVEAMRLGAFDYLEKPIPALDRLRHVVQRAAESRSRRDSPSMSGEVGAFQLTWGAPVMKPIEDAIRRVASSKATVLLTGESGVGKEVAARVIHDRSPRAKGPFVVVNCASLSETLLESELFGHERGAFTGAMQRRRGRLELADGGTFFLDEVGELRPSLQARLLRVLQTRSFERIGGSQTITTDVRWIAATNRDLPAMMAEGHFRADLYHRLAVFPLKLPPLRERLEDIGPLMDYLLLEIGRDMGRGPLTLAPEFRQELMGHHWPGNIRELMNVLERAAILNDGRTLKSHPMVLGPLGGLRTRVSGDSGPGPRGPRVGTLEEMEREAIRRALAKVQGNRRQAAEELGIGLRTLYTKLKLYELS